MRHDDREEHEDAKSPRPIAVAKKRTNRSELAEVMPVMAVEHDRHSHV